MPHNIQVRVVEIQQVLARYHRLATLGQLVDTILHDGRAPLSKIRADVQLCAWGSQQPPNLARVRRLQ